MSPIQWLVAQTRCSSEYIAKDNLERQDYEPLLPELLKRTVQSGRFQTIPRPMFPGYIFIGVRTGQPWRSIDGTRGIKRLIYIGEDIPAKITSAVIQEIRLQSWSDESPEEDEIGEMLRVTKGPLAGFSGLCMKSDKERVELLLDILGKESRVRVPRSQVRVA